VCPNRREARCIANPPAGSTVEVSFLSILIKPVLEFIVSEHFDCHCDKIAMTSFDFEKQMNSPIYRKTRIFFLR
jgi:hypothetical protein